MLTSKLTFKVHLDRRTVFHIITHKFERSLENE